ncbi:hypothetical protein EPI10_028590 [Gossypium australe]|uniref:Uncharacterized protein n=1 Tax=Gossypium australe TaxID=47621 RepID=A0A5B6UYJ6_9ROSI|nr:hypothetical protein EPI10_028590 [Gossypium australe]
MAQRSENTNFCLDKKWVGTYTIHQVTLNGAIELIGNEGQLVLVNGQRIKHYFGETTDTIVNKRIFQFNSL